MSKDLEANRFSARAARYAHVGANAGGMAARIVGAKLFGSKTGEAGRAAALAQALGELKGPLMKVAQLMATIPDLLPPEYAEELQKLQSDAPPMGPAFVRRRMMAELGQDWAGQFQNFDLKPSAAASLGQVHQATSINGTPLACKLQYPDMQSAVEADLQQLQVLFSLHRLYDGTIDTREIAKEIGERVREELDYTREAKHIRLYQSAMQDIDQVRVPDFEPTLSTRRLLTMHWLEGEKILAFKDASQTIRNRLAVAMFKAWWHPFVSIAVIHGDPHLGNYTVFSEGGEPQGLNLLDYGCIRIFPPRFVGGVVDLYQGLLHNQRDRVVHGYETWGFEGLSNDLIDILNIWAGFIFGPLLDDRVRTIAGNVKPSEYGRREAFAVHQALKKTGPVTVPREFVFMDRAAIGLGSVFLHLNAELNFHQLFENEMGTFQLGKLTKKQEDALAEAKLSNS